MDEKGAVRVIPKSLSKILVMATITLALGSCSDSSTSPDNAPEGHTVRVGGANHAPGLNNPLANCTQCHGADLRGGGDGQPSCFTCHGQKW